MDVISTVQSIEGDYGINPDKWPSDDARLKQLHEWYLNHSEEKKEKLTIQRNSKDPNSA